MECFVYLSNSTLVNIIVSPKGKGQDCMDQICQLLGTIEQDYFGLMYKANRGEKLWLNLRNRLDRQLLGQAPHRLWLRVKFYVPPHNLLQQSTRNLFYEQVKQDFEQQKLVVEREEQIQQVLALMAQADNGRYDQRTHQLNMYNTLYTNITEQEPSAQVIHDVVEAHIQLRDMSRETAQYQLLEFAAGLDGYGMELHEVSCGSDTVQVGIGPKGAILYNNDMEQVESLLYPKITKAEHIGKQCLLKVLSDNGMERDIEMRRPTQSSANALYRSITEMHSFFCCDTVHNEVSMQFSRDLKGTLASIFNEKTTLGRDYVFDIKRTSREALDHARRQLYQTTQTQNMDSELGTSNSDLSDNDFKSMNAEERCQVLVDALETIAESFTCCVCRDNELDAVLVPCGHMICMDCGERLTECPLCRKHIDSIQRIFFPTMQCKGARCMSSISLKAVTSPVHTHRHKRKLDSLQDTMAEP